MTRSAHDFSLIVDMPPGKYHYKFIVDNEWRYAPDQPTDTDRHGVLNNMVEINPQNIYEFEGADREDSLVDVPGAATTDQVKHLLLRCLFILGQPVSILHYHMFRCLL